MTISHIAGRTPDMLLWHIRWLFDQQGFRFTAKEISLAKSGELIYVKGIKLKEGKQFCGNHPAACERLGGRHHKMRFLEGADWVEFNDCVNDLLDTLVVSAVIQSSVRDGTTDRLPLRIRCGMHRRSVYTSGYFNGSRSSPNENHVWTGRGNHDAHYAVNSGFDCSRPEKDNAEFPTGTPGVNTRTDYFEIG